jgi:hypothetical protein
VIRIVAPAAAAPTWIMHQHDVVGAPTLVHIDGDTYTEISAVGYDDGSHQGARDR